MTSARLVFGTLNQNRSSLIRWRHDWTPINSLGEPILYKADGLSGLPARTHESTNCPASLWGYALDPDREDGFPGRFKVDGGLLGLALVVYLPVGLHGAWEIRAIRKIDDG